MAKLVIFYSRSGRTKALASGIAQEMGAKTEEIRVKKVKNRLPGAMAMTGAAKKGKLPPVYHESIAIEQFSEIFIGGPVWGGSAAPPVLSFIQDKDWKGKKVYTFVTCAFFGGKNALRQMKKALEERGASVLSEKDFRSLFKSKERLKSEGIQWAKELSRKANNH
ncbi:MAG: hypothetical protein PWP60_163 [Candidatus Atribacteria bacterium]|jgi:flavodoxin|nr:hypothetical protein [Candidatus Atribacteria bacterium]MDI3530314.1 hypothetical protein [Candidatus Atribacteria bacterium]